jgi:hypothetical protein
MSLIGKLFGKRTPGGSSAQAHAYRRADRILVRAFDRTVWATAGFWVASGPVATVPVTDAPGAVGQAVLDALARSRVEVPVPERGVDLETPLRKAAGVRSGRAFMDGTRLCVITRDERHVRVEPHHNGGNSGEDRGFTPLGDASAILLATDTDATSLGEAVLAALDRATATTRS